eukprot:10678255-Lingulodinium_polyedra.AAC.1
MSDEDIKQAWMLLENDPTVDRDFLGENNGLRLDVHKGDYKSAGAEKFNERSYEEGTKQQKKISDEEIKRMRREASGGHLHMSDEFYGGMGTRQLEGHAPMGAFTAPVVHQAPSPSSKRGTEGLGSGSEPKDGGPAKRTRKVDVGSLRNRCLSKCRTQVARLQSDLESSKEELENALTHRDIDAAEDKLYVEEGNRRLDLVKAVLGEFGEDAATVKQKMAVFDIQPDVGRSLGTAKAL